MEKTVQTKFYYFDQNNSGGYFVKDDVHGICESVIIEAVDAKNAWERLQSIGKNVSGFNAYCSCCGERWSDYLSDDDGRDVPMIYDTKVEEYKKGPFHQRCFVHYLDGTFQEIIFKEAH